MGKTAVAVVIGVAGLAAVALTVGLVVGLKGADPQPQEEPPPSPQLDRAVGQADGQGSIIGSMSEQAGMFFGIPFSQPPLGNYRWRNPRDPVPFPNGVWDATFIRPACVQICHQPAEEYSCPHEWDEDCLYLNVWVPRRLMKLVESDEVIAGQHYVIDEAYQDGGDNSLAVMVFFYGGNFLNGAGSATLYDSRYLAHQGDVIGVTTNYRVGPLGFLVQGEGEDAAIGNFGVWDQIKTLEWVQKNIRYFGGNADKVTVFGQSAGAESIGVMMTSPYVRNLPRPLFHQTIMESNPFGLPFRDYANAKEFGSRFTEAAGCLRDDMECLRRVDTNSILKAYNETSLEVVGVDKLLLIFQPWSPVIDGDFLPMQPVDAFALGDMMQIPSIFGGTVDEAVLYIALAFGGKVNNLQYRAVLRAIMKQDAQAIIQEYPPACTPQESFLGVNCDNRDLLGVLGTEYIFLCPIRYALSALTSENTYFYAFNQTWSFYELWEIPMCYDAVCHAAELPYVFNIENLTIYEYDPAERILAQRMIYYWTNFAKYADPNGPPSQSRPDIGAVNWPRFRDTNSEEEYFGLQITADGDIAMKNPYKEICDFFDQLDSYADHFKLP